MKIPRIARKYARAFFESVGATAAAREKLDELSAAAAALEVEGASALKLLTHPRLSPANKTELVGKLFTGRMSEPALQLLMVLARRNRFRALSGILVVLEELVLAAEGIQRAHVTTAVPLDDGQRRMIVERLAGITGKTIRMTEGVDRAVIGGIVIRIGDRLIDGSVRFHLAKMRDGLKAVRIPA
jgi:F-type H+-transporting ATPase subunit delta